MRKLFSTANVVTYGGNVKEEGYLKMLSELIGKYTYTSVSSSRQKDSGSTSGRTPPTTSCRWLTVRLPKVGRDVWLRARRAAAHHSIDHALCGSLQAPKSHNRPQWTPSITSHSAGCRASGAEPAGTGGGAGEE
nr:TraM recognition domain-containing protein [Kocuria flava]